MRRWAGRGREYRWREARRSEAQPRWGPGAKPRRGVPRLPRNELKMFHNQILSRNEAWFVKISRQMTDYNETIIKHIFKPKMTEIIKTILKPKMTACNETIIKNIFKHWTSWVVVRAQWFVGQYCSEREGRGYRCRCTSVPLSLYFISILWRLVMTAFHGRPKRRRFFPFPNNHRRPSKVFFFVPSQRFSLLFSLLSLYGLAFRHFFTVQQVTKAAVSMSESDKISYTVPYFWAIYNIK